MNNNKPIIDEELAKKLMQTTYFMALKILKNESDAEDIASDAMITIIEKADELRDEKAFDSWVGRIVINKCYNYIKKTKPVLCGDYGNEFLDEGTLEEFNTEFLPEEFALNKEKRKLLMEIIKEDTTEIEMMTIMHFYYNGESISYIAQNMDCAEITVKKRLASARKKIKDGIEKRLGKGAILMAAAITVLCRAMKVEASETAIPETLAAKIDLNKINGGTKMNKISGKGLSKAAIAGIGAGITAGIIAIVAVVVGIVTATNNNSNKTDTTPTIPITMETTQSTEFTENQTDAPTEPVTDATTPVQEEFERYKVGGIDFIAPASRTETDKQCNFFWNYTEDDFINWFHENFKTTDIYEYNVSNGWGEGSKDKQRVYDVKTLVNGDETDISITTTMYNKDIPSSIAFTYNSKDLDTAIDAVKKYIDYMGLGEFENDIIHSDSTIRVKTENNIGEYEIITYYSKPSYSEIYTLRLTISYYDSDFKYDTDKEYILPTKMEYFDDNHTLFEYFTISELNSSSLDNFLSALVDCTKNNINESIEDTIPTQIGYSYKFTSENSKKILTGVNYDLKSKVKVFTRKNGDTKYGDRYIYFTISLNDDNNYETRISIEILPIMDDLKYEENASDKDISLVCEARYNFLEKFLQNSTVTVDELLGLCKDGGSYTQTFEKENVNCKIFNDFDYLSINLIPLS